MEFIRLRNVSSELFTHSWEHYKTSFPENEQRTLGAQTALMPEEDYYCCVITDNGSAVGSILYWQSGTVIYVEHFFIYPAVRGGGIGARSLRHLMGKACTVILEIDPPKDSISIRRRAFYERCGFTANPFRHLHPPYRTGYAPHSLVIMSAPEALSEKQYGNFYAFLCRRVMKYK